MVVTVRYCDIVTSWPGWCRSRTFFLSYGEISSGRLGPKVRIVILLLHGLDGAGPEHSSCRMERFLQVGWALRYVL